MVQKSPNLLENLQNADYLLSLEPEELAGPLLIYLDGNQNIDLEWVISYGSMFQAFDDSIRLSEARRRKMRQKYPHEHDNDILCALMEAWQWLEKERIGCSKTGFRARNPCRW